MISPKELERLWKDHAASLELIARGRCGTPEDCVQEAFIQLAKQLPVPTEPQAWLWRVVRNKAINAGRSQRRQRDHENRAGQSKAVWVEANSEMLNETCDTSELTAALEQMDHDLRDVLVAHVWSNMTFREIGEAFSISHAAAHRRYQQAIKYLRFEFEAQIPTALKKLKTEKEC